ncbi:MAG: acetylxylan esterase [Caldilineaceae bacterium]|nr:acetylxylan esterase [Caldilineaceae bacterium]
MLPITPKPTDFDQYWTQTQQALATLPPAPELTAMPLRTTDFGTVYGLRLTSLAAYRIFAYYCVPHGAGPFPVLYQLPNYGSVVQVPPYEERQSYIAVALCHRGQRLADQPFAASYPGLLTTAIDQPEQYIYRGIVADCLRVLDFLATRTEVDQQKIAAVGGDLALITAALRPLVAALYYTPGFFYAAAALIPQTSAYPSEEINDYLRTYPDRAAQLWQTLAYYEPTHFAAQVRATPRVVISEDATRTAPLLAAFGRPVASYVSAHSGYKDGVAQARWLHDHFGLGEPLLPEHWR